MTSQTISGITCRSDRTRVARVNDQDAHHGLPSRAKMPTPASPPALPRRLYLPGFFEKKKNVTNMEGGFRTYYVLISKRCIVTTSQREGYYDPLRDRAQIAQVLRDWKSHNGDPIEIALVHEDVAAKQGAFQHVKHNGFSEFQSDYGGLKCASFGI